MSKKFSIVTTINLTKLNEEIEEYKCLTGEENPYLFMHKDTMNMIEQEFCPEILDQATYLKRKSSGVEATYYGYKIFANNELKFGTVEIR